MPKRTTNQGTSKVSERTASEAASSQITLDDIDRRIISLLQVDGRRPYGAVADDVGIGGEAG